MNEPIKLPPIDSREGFSDYVEMHMRDYAISAVRQAVAAEREACARVCEVRSEGWNQARTKDDYQMCALGAKNEARALTAAIRARGEK